LLHDSIRQAPAAAFDKFFQLERTRTSSFVRENGHGLEFYDLEIMREDANVLSVSGQIRNLGDGPALVPEMRLIMLAQSGESVFEGGYGLKEQVVIGAGEAIGIWCELDACPSDAVSLEISFSSR
jgi:hypothetical protein